jgi:hypothetical protein
MKINALLLVSCLVGLASSAVADPECNNGVSMNIVAHEDDDLLFVLICFMTFKAVAAFAPYS